jgi:hypothetical protein
LLKQGGLAETKRLSGKDDATPFCHFFGWQETKESSKWGLFVLVLFEARLAGFSCNSGMRVHGWYQLY